MPAVYRGNSASPTAVAEPAPAATPTPAIGADAALASLKPRAAPAPAAQPPQLRWSDGRLSPGRLETTPSGHYRFQPERDSEVLAERFANKPWKQAPEQARPIDVRQTSSGAVVARLPSLHALATVREHGLDFQVATSADGATFAIQRADLARLVTVTGGLPGGLTAPQRLAARRLLGDAVAAIADRCTDPQAARRAAAALSDAPWVNVHLVARGGTVHSLGDDAVAGEELFSFQPPQSIEDRLSQLEVGAHVVVPWAQFSERAGHTMVLSFTRVSESRVRLTAVNSATFALAFVSQHKTVSLDAAGALLARMRDGALPARPPYLPPDLWLDPATGAMLEQALHEADPSSPALSPRREESTTRQKQPADCGMESYFAWLSTVMPPADYKLAKAAMLHALAELADDLAKQASPKERDLLAQARTRLNERLTTSMAGSTVAPGRGT